VPRFQIFVIRAVLGVVFGVVISRFFYPDAPLIFVIGLILVLLGLAYLVEYLRIRKSGSR
jgi:uncharacterized membrane protein HdeD (DUF308 family)